MTMKTSLHQRFRAIQLQGTPEQPSANRAPTFERELAALLASPLRPDETYAVGHDRKEREIRALLASLTPTDAWHLHKRLSRAAADDQLATAFARLVAQRRMRLLAFLGDPKRRAAQLERAESRTAS